MPQLKKRLISRRISHIPCTLEETFSLFLCPRSRSRHRFVMPARLGSSLNQIQVTGCRPTCTPPPPPQKRTSGKQWTAVTVSVGTLGEKCSCLANSERRRRKRCKFGHRMARGVEKCIESQDIVACEEERKHGEARGTGLPEGPFEATGMVRGRRCVGACAGAQVHDWGTIPNACTRNCTNF